MPYQFREFEDDLQPQASASLGGGPPRKTIAAGVLDPPIPPKRPPGPLASIPAQWWLRAVAAVALLAILVGLLAFLLRPH